MRLIDGDRLKEEVLKWLPSDPCGIEEREFPFETDIVASLLMEIEEAPSIEQEPNWIPCIERLPNDKEDTYWICTDSGYQCECRWTNDRWGFGESDTWGWKPIDIPQYTKVVAWMSLPEPWKGAEECLSK